MDFLKKHSFKIAVLALCLGMGIYLLMTNVFKPEKPMPVLQEAPAFELTDLDGNKVTKESTNGKARLVYFYFANCPDVCPPTTFLLSQVQEGLEKEGILGTDAEMISITFDPERDTTEVIKAFAERNYAKLNEGWMFLRGDDPQAAIKLAQDFGASAIKDKEGTGFTHMNVITLVDKTGQIRKWIAANNEELTPESIVADMKRLAKE
ncbi:SCO family protein [Paenibacillus sp. KS-LC4]|uniref:SCO family protein n=1 Tax=Paenibacillus sp. KS-LC4 TaxID=2979727 RepID=UPI0030CEF462